MTNETKPEKPTAPGLQGNNKNSDIQTLISGIRDGDHEAFTKFYMGYGDSIVAFLTKILGNQEDAKEVTQETFILLWENREKLDPHTSIKGYVSAMARNLAVNMIRSKSKRLESDDYVFQYKDSIGDHADEELISKETAILIKNALRNMPNQRRKVFEMSREEGLSYNEIADRLNISYNTVKTHMQAALTDIRTALACVLVFCLIY